MEFYIRETSIPDGPHDLVAVIRKIRNGNISEKTMISREIEEEPQPAQTFPELHEFFSQHKQSAVAGPQVKYERNLIGLLKTGGDFLKSNGAVSIYSGVFMVLWIVIVLLCIVKAKAFSIAVGAALCFFLMGGYMEGILRFMRGNPVTPTFIVRAMAMTSVPMAITALIFGMLLLPGIVLLTAILSGVGLAIGVPIFIAFLLILVTSLIFAPLLITEKGYDFMDAIRSSVDLVWANKGEQFGVYFSLIAINFLFLPFMPVVWSVTMAAFIEIFEEKFP